MLDCSDYVCDSMVFLDQSEVPPECVFHTTHSQCVTPEEICVTLPRL